MLRFSLLFLSVFIFHSLSFSQEIRKENLTRAQKNYYDYKKTKLLSTGSFYKDLGGETGFEHGEWNYYDKDGKLEETRNYFRGKLNGLVLLSWPNGKKKEEGYFKMDVQDSIYRTWNVKGILEEEGFYKNGLKDSVWEYFYSNGKPKLIEKYIDTTRYTLAFWTADSVQTIKDGNGYLIDFYLDGQIKSAYSYKDGLPEGEFIEYQITGDTAVWGSYHNNLKDGKWKQFFYNGKVEKIVHYQDGKLNGAYQVFYDNGKLRTTGYYRNGMKDRDWIWYANNGILDMRGSFLEDEQHGEWTYYYPNEKISYIAQFKKGKKDGQWQYFYKDGSKFKIGNFKDDEKDGDWKTWYENGVLLMEGKYIAGKEDGVWNNYWEKGNLKNKATFKNGKLDGNWISYSINGKMIVSGTYKEGLKNKAWTEFYNNGKPKEVITYKIITKKSKVKYGPMKGRKTKESVEHGSYIAFSPKDFKRSETGNYKNGEKDGIWYNYYPLGKIVAVMSTYKNGKLSGVMRQFDRKGNIQNESHYKNGVKHGTLKIYDAKGKIIKQKDFEYGEEKKYNLVPNLKK